MSSVNVVNPKVDTTVRIFDDFYRFQIQVPTNEYDAVYSYFRSVFPSSDAAKSFTMVLFQTARQSQIPVLDLLTQLQGQDPLTLTANMAYFMNGLRSPATLLGVNAAVTPNAWAARNIMP